MADPFTTFAIDNTQVYAVTASRACTRILVQENYDSANPPTADLLQYFSLLSTTPVRIAKGTPAIFTPTFDSARPAKFVAGQVVGGIKTSSGSITVQQIESSSI